MTLMIEETRKEEGCLEYSYAIDVLTPDRLVVLEYWESWEALDAHFEARHMKNWRAALGSAGKISRDITAARATDKRKI